MATDLMAPVLRLHTSAKELADFVTLVERLESVRRTSGSLGAFQESAAVAVAGLLPTLAGTVWKRQYYSFIIVQLYGMHERFIRDLVESFARLMGQIFGRYDDLPERLRRQHLLLTLQHLQELGQNSLEDLTLLHSDVGRLWQCLDGIIQLNERAMSRHSANFRHEVIRNVLARLDFDLQSAGSDEYFQSFPFGALNGLYATPEAVIDDLADRRNEVAHGSDFELLDIETLKDIADTVYRFDVWLFRALSREQMYGLVSREGQNIGTVNHVWRDELTGERTVGQFLDVSSEIWSGAKAYVVGDSVKACLIKEVQANHTKIESAAPGAGPFGINFDVTVKENQELRILAAKWSEVESVLRSAAEECVQISFSED